MTQNGGDPSANLQELFASLKPSISSGAAARQSEMPSQTSAQSSEKTTFTFQPPQLQQIPSHSSPFAMSQDYSPSFNLAHPRERSTNPHIQAHHADKPKDDRTANLLNLLKFNNPAASPQPQPQSTSQQPSAGLRQNSSRLASPQSTHSIHGRGISASDLVASFMGTKPSTPASRETTPAPASASHQDLLLSLLNHPANPHSTIAKEDPPQKTSDQKHNVSAVEQNQTNPTLDEPNPSKSTITNVSQFTRKESPIRVFGSNEPQPSPFEPQNMPRSESTPQKGSIFTYVNPFEQLAASSPRNIQSTPPHGECHKRKSKEPSPNPGHTNLRRKVTSSGEEVLQSIESPTPARLDDGRTQIEALIGIGAPTQDTETVAQALNDVGEKVDREAENALAEAEAEADEKERQAEVKKEELELAQEETRRAMAETAHETAVQVKKELDKEENKGLLEEAVTTPVAEMVKDIIDETAQENVPDEWESADAAETGNNDDREQVVKVYQFPLKPFVSISVTPANPPELDIRPDSIIEVARFRKDFDQIDRILATATPAFIAYSVIKPGGVRIIRQDDGASQQIFNGAKDRIFSVSISVAHGNSALRGTQNIIATGVSGSVYWTTLAKADGVPFEAEVMEKMGLVIPPSAAQTESTSNGQLKTRARASSRHPEFFAIGRGKLIHIIFPFHARSSKHANDDSYLDTDGYFQERSLKLSTGKAGKDFAFSEDDSAIVTLDKAGRLRFWDITELVDESNGIASRLASIDVKTPIHNIPTTHPAQKSWPTSVVFIDKVKAYQKGIAQRYVLVGMKQNHTLQLWDLGLGKAVQEVNFPHEKEDDPICSITYHAPSSVLVVGHPTRNSLYFLHLSAPKYTVPPMSQAHYLKKVFSGHSSIPKTEVTAIMSGLREYSFNSKGHIRSVDLAPTAGDPTKAVDDEDDPTLFELYVTHSRGVTCLGVKKQDLGWSQDNRVLNPVNAEKEGEITVKDLSALLPDQVRDAKQANGESTPSQQNSATPKTPKSKSDSSKSVLSLAAKARDAQPEIQETSRTTPAIHEHLAEEPAPNAITEKADKKKKKKRGAGNEDQTSTAEVPAVTPSNEIQTDGIEQDSPTKTTRHPLPSASQDNINVKGPDQGDRPKMIANGESINLGISGDFLDKELKKIETGVSKEFNKVLTRELESLYRRIDDDKRVQDAAGAAKQDAMLRLVSSTLSSNVDKALARIIDANIRQSVIPALADALVSILDQRLAEALAQQLQNAIPAHLKLILPEAVGRSVQSPEVLRALSEQITSKVSGHVDKEFTSVLHSSITPAFKNLAVNVAQKTSLDVENRVREQLRLTEIQQRKDTAKIEELTLLVRGLSETVHTMAAAQSEFQQEILRLQSQAAQERQANAIRETSRQPHGTSASSHHSITQSISPEQAELNGISSMMSENRYEEAVIQVSPYPHTCFIQC